MCQARQGDISTKSKKKIEVEREISETVEMINESIPRSVSNGNVESNDGALCSSYRASKAYQRGLDDANCGKAGYFAYFATKKGLVKTVPRLPYYGGYEEKSSTIRFY